MAGLDKIADFSAKLHFSAIPNSVEETAISPRSIERLRRRFRRKYARPNRRKFIR
jgi:hypothetical protein